ncbi:MAG: hypothetical protein ACP5IX_02995 [Patescibacteria group bacterium]
MKNCLLFLIFSPPKKNWTLQRGRLGREVQGENAKPPEMKRSPAVLLVQNIAPQKSFLFLLPARIATQSVAGGEEKNRRAQNKQYEENFFAGWRALASGGGAERQSSQSRFSSKKVRILSKRCRFVREKAPTPKFGVGAYRYNYHCLFQYY